MKLQGSPGAVGAPAETLITVVQSAGEGQLSVSEAGRMLREARKPKEQHAQVEESDPASAAVPAAVGTPHESTPAQVEADAAPQKTEAPGETESQAESVDARPIEPPKSWTNEAKERWQSLPRETQEYLAEREQERERELRSGQNETAEKLKGLSAKEQAVDQARQQYESALPLLLDNLQSVMQGEFSDVKTMADVQKMAAEDWPRYVRWDAQQKQVAAVQQEVRGAEERRTAELKERWTEFAKREDFLFAEKAPEMADKDKAAKLQGAAVSVLKELGFSDEELSRSYHGKHGMSLRDHRVQLLVRDATLWHEAQARLEQQQPRPFRRFSGQASRRAKALSVKQ